MVKLYEIRGLQEWISDMAGFDLYKELSTRDRMNFQPGQFYTAHVKYPLVSPTKVLELVKYNPADESKTTFKISNFDRDSRQQAASPVKFLDLRSNERLYILVGKPRTVIVLGYVEHEWIKTKREKVVLCLPIASFNSEHTEEQIISIQCFQVPHLSYIKPVTMGPNHEGVARFELIQPIQAGELQPVTNSNRVPFKLSSGGFNLLLNHLAKFLSGEPLDKELDKEISAFRDLVKQELETFKDKGD